MKKSLSAILSVFLIASLCFCAGFAWQKGDCTRDQLKDGSCKLAGDCLQVKKQLKDGSCKLAGDCLRVKKQLKDGSCAA